MSVKKQWVLWMVAMAVLSIVVNSLLFSNMIDRYYTDEKEEEYQAAVAEIVEYARYAIEENPRTMEIQMALQSYRVDPIRHIMIVNETGEVIGSVSQQNRPMHGGMMGGRFNGESTEETGEESVDIHDVYREGEWIGQVHITSVGTVADTETASLFQSALLRISLISGILVLILAALASYWISKRTAKSLVETADFATSIQRKDVKQIKPSSVVEIRQIQQALEDLQGRLKLKEIIRKRNMDTVLHETRTPVTVIKSNVEGLKDQVLQPSERLYDTILLQLDQLIFSLENLPTMIEFDGNREKEDQKEVVNLYEVTSYLIGGLKPQTKERNITFSIEGDQTAVLETNKHAIVQILYNLLTNALKYTEQGSVQVKIAKEEQAIEIEVKDTGRGIDPANREKIFEPYFREGQKEKGEGLGLYVVKKNVEQLGGTIEVESNKPHGTIVRLTLAQTRK
ncbi:MAG TPA: hypothetical protein DHN33_06885 [Eubacteriaceae bacterium]|nr:hypothetical protein [Eubacteriaceae bacterium]